MARNIQESLASLIAYVDDGEALRFTADTISNPEMKSLRLELIANFKEDWKDWLKR